MAMMFTFGKYIETVINNTIEHLNIDGSKHCSVGCHCNVFWRRAQISNFLAICLISLLIRTIMSETLHKLYYNESYIISTELSKTDVNYLYNYI